MATLGGMVAELLGGVTRKLIAGDQTAAINRLVAATTVTSETFASATRRAPPRLFNAEVTAQLGRRVLRDGLFSF